MARAITAFRQRIEIAVDNAQASRALAQTEKQIGQITKAGKGFLGAFSSEAAAGIEKIQGLTGSLGTLASGLGVSAGPAGILAGSLASIGTVAAGAGIALFKLADSSAEYGDKVYKASEKTALSAETISALAIAGKEVGLEIEDVAGGLSKFTINMAAAAEGNEKFAAKFQKMGIDVKEGIKDPDKALADFIKRFEELPDKQSRIAAASGIFGKKFGANLVAMFDEVGGSLDEFEKKLRDMGLLVDDQTAEQSHQFEKMKKDFEVSFAAMTRTIGFEVIPAFESMFTSVNASLEANQQNWKRWGDDIAVVILGIEGNLSALHNFVNKLDWTNALPLYGNVKTLLDLTGAYKDAVKDTGTAYRLALHPPEAGIELPRIFGMKKPKGFFDEEDGDGDGEKKKKAAKRVLDPLEKYRQLLERVTERSQSLTDKSEHMRVELEFQRSGIEKLTGKVREAAEEFKKLALVQADIIDTNKEAADVQEKLTEDTKKEKEAITAFLQRQREELDQLLGIEHSASEAYAQFIVNMKDAPNKISDVDLAMMKLNATSIDFLKTYQKLNAEIEAPAVPRLGEIMEDYNKKIAVDLQKQIFQLGPPPAPVQNKWKDFFKKGLFDAIGEVASQIPQQKQVSKKRGFFSKLLGVAAPFLSFIPGIGPIASMAAGALSQGLAGNWGGALQSIASGFGPGGAISGMLSRGGTPGINVSALGEAPAPTPTIQLAHRAAGGPVYTGRPYLVGERGPELFVPGQGGAIAANGGGNMAAVLEGLRVEISRLGSMPPEHVVMKGAHGISRAMDSDASLADQYGRRLRLA